MIPYSSLNLIHVGSKTRSQGRVSLKPCSPFGNLAQNVCLDDF